MPVHPLANQQPNGKGAPIKIYGATWCGHCHHQVESFMKGDVNYKFIDATKNPKIKAYPTLMCGTKSHTGEMTAVQAKQWCPEAAIVSKGK